MRSNFDISDRSQHSLRTLRMMMPPFRLRLSTPIWFHVWLTFHCCFVRDLIERFGNSILRQGTSLVCGLILHTSSASNMKSSIERYFHPREQHRTVWKFPSCHSLIVVFTKAHKNNLRHISFTETNNTRCRFNSFEHQITPQSESEWVYMMTMSSMQRVREGKKLRA